MSAFTGGKGQRAPQTPDYGKLADQQKQNSENNYQGALGQTGTWSNVGGGEIIGRKPWGEPIYSKGHDVYTETLGQPSQQIIDNSLSALGKPVDLSNEAVTKSVMDTAMQYMQPYWQQQEGSLDQKLANQGIDPNSQAGINAKRQQSDAESRAMNQYLLAGRQQAVNEALAGRNQNLQEAQGIMALNRGQAPGTQGADLVGAAQNQYGADMQRYNQQQQSNNQLLGAAAGALGSLALSDQRAKQNIRQIGLAHNGLPIYIFSYKDDPRNIIYMGLMAQDVEIKHPHAVVSIDGVKHVDYLEATK